MKNIFTLIKKELKDYFISPIAYVVIIVFLVILEVIFTSNLFLINQANMRNVFELIPLIFIAVIPAITMRSWSEEKKEETLELLSTLPMSNMQLIISKFLSNFIFILITLLLTLPIPITINKLGNPDNGVVWAGYLGLVLLSGAYVGIGQLVSINTQNQIVSFIVSGVIIGLLYLFGEPRFLDFVPSGIQPIIESFGLGSHFRSVARGVIDTRDLFYYFAITGISIFFIYKSLIRIKTQGK